MVCMDERKAQVLRALVEEHIRTGEPVSSRSILERTGMRVSPATIRNDLAALERDGYLRQPHTSAGRVPTNDGFRFYVDTVDPTRLHARTRERIAGFFTSFHRELRALLKETSELLTDITNYPAVVVGPGFSGETVHSISLVRLSTEVLLLVIVTEAGRVTQELVRLPRLLDDKQVDELESFLVAKIVGKSIDDIRSLVAAEAKQLSASTEVVESVAEAAVRTKQESREIFVGGTSVMASLWEDLRKVHDILELVDRQSALLKLIESDHPGTKVVIGPDVGVDVDLSVVSTSYGSRDHGPGRLAVLGPTRMDYRRTIRVVEEVGEGLSDKVES
jgi:heat-inducible transcriptional repressor